MSRCGLLGVLSVGVLLGSCEGGISPPSDGDSSQQDGGEPADEHPDPVAKPCDALPAKGVWEQITPPVTTLPHNEPCPYGGAMAMNPRDPAMIYVGTCNQGIWKSEDCGATWEHINKGKNGVVLDTGRQWTFAIDPVNPKIMYTNSGYGSMSNGAFKSTNGGVDWEPIWPPPGDPSLADVVDYNFVAHVALDPDHHEHLLLTFHAACKAPHPAACFAESDDGGEHWRIVDGLSEWAGGEGSGVYFLTDSKTWLWGSQSNGLWRTEDSGANWTAVSDSMAVGHASGQMYRAVDGTFYLPATGGILRSKDGIEWALVPDSGNTMKGLTGTGKTMYASRGFPWDPSSTLYLPFWSSSEDDGRRWTKVDSPMLSNGGDLYYDSVHHLLYSTNLGAGVYRVVVD